MVLRVVKLIKITTAGCVCLRLHVHVCMHILILNMYYDKSRFLSVNVSVHVRICVRLVTRVKVYVFFHVSVCEII